MKIKIEMIITVLTLCLLSLNIYAQNDEWITENTEDGKIIVKSRISKRIDEESKEVQLIEYVATTIASVNMQNCVSVLKDISKHKEILNEKITKKIKTISENEWLLYYYFDAPWPIPNSDCVTRMSFFEDTVNNVATFTLNAEPSTFKTTDVKRVTFYNVTYEFKDIGNGFVEMTSTAKLTPIVQAPEWIVRKFFPAGPARYLERLLKLAEDI